MKYIDIEDMARYISQRVGCSFEDGIDYQYSQRDYMDSRSLEIMLLLDLLPL